MQPAAERFWTALEQHSGIALSEGTRQLSYAELRHEVAARASRLEALNKLYGSGIIIGEETRRAAGDAVVARPLDRVAVYGREKGVETYELLGPDETGDGAWLSFYERGRDALEQRDGAVAERLGEVLPPCPLLALAEDGARQGQPQQDRSPHVPSV